MSVCRIFYLPDYKDFIIHAVGLFSFVLANYTDFSASMKIFAANSLRLRFSKTKNQKSEDFKTEWNNGKERATFEREQAKKRKEYLAAGMTEEQIQSLYEYDLDWFNICRREAEHTQSLDIQTSEDEDSKMDNPLYKKFFEKLAVEDNHADYSRYGWIEEIENKEVFYI